MAKNHLNSVRRRLFRQSQVLQVPPELFDADVHGQVEALQADGVGEELGQGQEGSLANRSAAQALALGREFHQGADAFAAGVAVFRFGDRAVLHHQVEVADVRRTHQTFLYQFLKTN